MEREKKRVLMKEGTERNKKRERGGRLKSIHRQ